MLVTLLDSFLGTEQQNVMIGCYKHNLNFTASVYVQERQELATNDLWKTCIGFVTFALQSLVSWTKLNYSVHVNTVSDGAIRVDGGQCKV